MKFSVSFALIHPIMNPAPLAYNPELDLRIERIVPVSPEEIWDRWTQAELMPEWFCPAPWKLTSCEVDPRPGGKFDGVMEGPQGERIENRGCFLFLVPNKVLVFTTCLGAGYRPTGNTFMTASIELEAVEGGTRYVATVYHKDAETRSEHQEMGFEPGWNAALDQMVAAIEMRR